jgi:polysaccharide pyruvyl transferase WcaK-like protein
MTSNRSRRVIIYGAVSAPAPRENRWQAFKSSTRIFISSVTDAFLWRLGTLHRLRYQNYLTLRSVNRGDEAITAAARKQFLHRDSRLEFIDVNWGGLGAAIRDETAHGIDLIVIAGSGYIALDGKGNLSGRITEDLNALSATGAPMVLYGIGVNQLLGSRPESDGLGVAQSSESHLRQILARASLISVRDQASRALLAAFTDKTVHLTGDPALYYVYPQSSREIAEPSENTQPLIGINFAMHGPAANARFKRNFSSYVAALKRLQRLSGCRYVYFEHYQAEGIIPELLKISGIDTELVSGTPDILVRNYARLNLHIGEMLHSNILATSSGTPTIALSYDIKHAGFFSLLGMQRNCLSSVTFDADSIVSAALEIIKSEAALRASIKARREALEINANLFIDECMTLATAGKVAFEASPLGMAI